MDVGLSYPEGLFLMGWGCAGCAAVGISAGIVIIQPEFGFFSQKRN